MPVGELVASISCNDSQTLSDENIDGLRSACHDAAVPLDGESQQLFTAIANMGERLSLAHSYILIVDHVGGLTADPHTTRRGLTTLTSDVRN